MTNFANSFSVRYPTLGSVWKVLAEGETPNDLPAEWKSINYYAHVFSNDDDARVKAAAQAFLREIEIARLDSKSYAGRLMLASQTFAQAVCDQAGIAWKDDHRPALPAPQERKTRQSSVKPKPKPSSKAKTKSPTQSVPKKTGRSPQTKQTRR
jgi:hypothetical protein